MRKEAEFALSRFESMADMIGGEPEAVTALGIKDRKKYGTTYVLPDTPEGHAVVSNVLKLRFMVEVCGLTYKESIEALAEESPIDSYEWVDGLYEPAMLGQRLMERGNIAEAMIDLAIMRARAQDFPPALEKIDAAIEHISSMRFAPLYDGREWDE